jgi:proteic killer suppression protein
LTYPEKRYKLNISMIRSFRCRDTARLANDETVRRFQSFERSARRKMELLASAATLEDLGALPGNRLELLRGDRAGQYSIRINSQWRICFNWLENDAFNVEIVDYH